MPPPLKAAARLGVSYRSATEADLAFVASVYASTRTEEVAASGWPLATQMQFLAHQADAQHRHYRAHYSNAEWLVIERGDRPIGRLYLEEWPDQIRLIDISLLPDGRGGGVGGAILSDLQEAAAAAGKPLSIHVERNNPAMSLYLRLGFARIGDHGIYDLMEWRPESRAP
ncbi:MAG TPA: GNAT family N-acetyltransferase [Allosphingosinicella sp.]|jgi:GNAT superfamily N-acetyltransferase|nr:GNAT family N-acetyltransferase [Allosphingosinicella sp.]